MGIHQYFLLIAIILIAIILIWAMTIFPSIRPTPEHVSPPSEFIRIGRGVYRRSEISSVSYSLLRKRIEITYRNSEVHTVFGEELSEEDGRKIIEEFVRVLGAPELTTHDEGEE